jgi:GNAT superfamily N-acetyltransferase
VCDVLALQQFLQSLSPKSLYYRFHMYPALTEPDVRALIGADGGTATTLIAESGGRIVAFAGYYPRPGDSHRAEVSFAVSDAVQGHGIGTRLLEQLANVAREAGITTFDAYVLAVNRPMLDVFRNSGFTETLRLEGGMCHVTLSLAMTEQFVEHAAARSQIAAAASMRAFF